MPYRPSRQKSGTALPAPLLVVGGMAGLQGGAALAAGLYPAVGPAGVVLAVGALVGLLALGQRLTAAQYLGIAAVAAASIGGTLTSRQ